MTASVPAVSLRGITKVFGAVRANNDISLDIHAGRIKALLGENGAGKSTLMSILAGHYLPDSGEILIDGQHRTLRSTKDAPHALNVAEIAEKFGGGGHANASGFRTARWDVPE